jgi:hypothetical protein
MLLVNPSQKANRNSIIKEINIFNLTTRELLMRRRVAHL